MASKLLDKYSFLVDVNLPKYFSFFNDEKFVHIVDLNPRMTDDDVWEYAIKHDKVILTKDADFYSKSISSIIKPKVIYFQLGNMTLAELHRYFELNWESLCNYLEETSLIIAERDNIKIVV
jgi:predicted nuclease of predicted toxin-antitoxin system